MISQPFFTKFKKSKSSVHDRVIILLLVIIGIIRNMSKLKTYFSMRIMGALVLGLAYGRYCC